MAIISFSVKETYVPSWGTWEAIREAIQNGLDEDSRGHRLTVSYSNGWLRIHNEGADMKTDALLWGETDKRGNPELIGEHGDGLGTGLLAGVRAGYEIKITTQTETWVPFIAPAENFGGQRVLQVRTRKLQRKQPGVTVAIKVPEEEWEKAQDLFLRFARLDRAVHVLEVPDHGTIITDPEYAGRVYVKGIFVQHIPDLVFSYNLPNARVDRDRRLVDEWDLKWTLASIYKYGVAIHPEKLRPIVYTMVRDDRKDTQGLRYDSSEEIPKAVAAQWAEEHGDNAVPVNSIGDSEKVNTLGHRGVVANDTLRHILGKTHVPTAEAIQDKLRKATTRAYSWEELDRHEQVNLSTAAAALDEVMPEGSRPLLDMVNVVDFHEDLKGLWETGKIQIAREALATPQDALKVLVHEAAHEISQCTDGLGAHTTAVENLWSALYWTGKWN